MHPKRLSFRFYPFPNEAYHGYLARLALNNGFSNTKTMLRWAQTNLGLKSQDSAKNVLRTLTQHPDSILENIPLKGPGPGKWRTHQIFGQDISYLWLRARRDCFICPICIREIESTRLVWQFSWTKTCAIHERVLISLCIYCGAHITYDKAARKRCGCGANFDSEIARDKDQLTFDNVVQTLIDAKEVPSITIRQGDVPLPKKMFEYLPYEAHLGTLCSRFQRITRVG